MSEKDNKNKPSQKNSDENEGKKVYTDPTILNSDTQFGGGGSADGSKKQSD